MYDGPTPKAIALASVLCPLSLLLLLLRFYARSKTTAKYSMDDGLALVAFLMLYAWLGMYLFCKQI